MLSVIMLSVAIYLLLCNVDMLSVIMRSFIKLIVVMLSVIMLSVIMLNVIMVSVLMLSVIMLNVVTPCLELTTSVALTVITNDFGKADSDISVEYSWKNKACSDKC